MKIILCAGKNGRALIYGTVKKTPVPGEPVTLTNAKMIIYYAAECGGLFGLAANGPKGKTRITAAVRSTTETVWQEHLSVSSEAAKAIEQWPAA